MTPVAVPPGPCPLTAVPAAAWCAVDGVLTDIDDTLTTSGVIDPAALDALHELADAAVPVIAVTGRPAGWSEPFARAWPVAAIVAENGGVMLRRDGDTLCVDFAQDVATRRANRARLRACAEAVLAELPGATLAQDSAGRLTDIAIDHAEFARLDAPQVQAVLAVMHRHGLHATVSSIHVNGWIGDHTKWTGACRAVQAVLGRDLDPARWVYVGDSANDEPMFERVPLSVGVANITTALPHLRAPPAAITASPRGRGFAEVAARVLAARGKRS